MLRESLCTQKGAQRGCASPLIHIPPPHSAMLALMILVRAHRAKWDGCGTWDGPDDGPPAPDAPHPSIPPTHPTSAVHTPHRSTTTTTHSHTHHASRLEKMGQGL